MGFFLKFKSSKTYPLYWQKKLEDWQQIIWKLGFLLIAIEGCRMIEDDKHGKPYDNWNLLWKIKVLNCGYYAAITWGRLLIVKLLPRFKIAFLAITDFMIIVAFVIILENSAKFPDPGSRDYNPIWIGKEYLRLYGGTFCLCFTFYTWFVPCLYMGAYFGYVCYLYVKLLPGYEWIYMPTYITIFFILVVLCYYLEKMKRTSFEENLDANMKEKVYKEILNEFPEGTLIINKKKEILYANHAFYSILNLNFEKGLEELGEINDKDISIEDYTADTGIFMSDCHPITKFQDLQDLIWSRWDHFVEYFSCTQSPDEYKMFKGTYQIDETRSKNIEIKFIIRNFGGQNVALFIFSDVSERLLVKYLKQTIEYKNKLLASVSHELRTPLNGNINFVQAAINDPSVPQQIKESWLVPALRSARYLLILINDFLDFSQMQAQSLRLVSTTKNIVETTKEAMELVEIQARRKGLNLSLNLVKTNWAQEIKTDHNRVLQIIANLLSNALKFTFQGGITVSLKPESGNIVCIEVEDTGLGIKDEDKSKLFKAFGKLDLGGKNHINSQGVGLGLVISNSLACMLGPKTESLSPKKVLPDEDEEDPESIGISFESEFGKGTKFWFRIIDQDEMKSHSNCIVASEGNKNELPDFMTTNSNGPLLASPSGCYCPEFLIADDDAFNILTLETMLSSLDMRSGFAYNGQQVLDILADRLNNPCCDMCQPYKMIFMDCNMPIMDGYECMAKLKDFFAEYPEWESPVIACTATTNKSEINKALECGMKDYVTKPINKARIQDLIRRHCSKGQNSPWKR